MPEGPEIRRMVDAIACAVAGRKASAVHFGLARHKQFESVLSARRVLKIQARGKAVVVFFSARGSDDAWCVYSHNQLYGHWSTGPSDRLPETNRQLRFAIIGTQQAARLYSASDIRIVRPARLHTIPYLARLGCDPLNDPITDAQLSERLQDKRFVNRQLAILLLDQGCVAGIGNYLRSEILFEAGLHPAHKPRNLTQSELDQLAAAMNRLIQRAYRLRGVTNDPDRAARLKVKGKSYAARRYMVFARAGRPCYVCGTTIVKSRIASRRLYRCPRCQPTPHG